MFSCMQFPCSGHSDLFLQLQVHDCYEGAAVALYWASMFLLCDEMMAFMFGIHE